MRSITAFVLPAMLGIYGIMLAAPSRAQVLYGSIVGQVADTTGAIVPGATVRITQQGNQPIARSRPPTPMAIIIFQVCPAAPTTS